MMNRIIITRGALSTPNLKPTQCVRISSLIPFIQQQTTSCQKTPVWKIMAMSVKQ